jgi:DNA-binding NarL/FixJ family response regulator
VAQVKAPRRSGLLTARERQVLGLVARGRSNKQIARDLAITERTIKFHMTSIFNKLGADNRAQAIAIAAQRSLL